jgi:hypothetical protein
MDLTSIFSLTGMFVVELVCIIRTEVVATHVLRQHVGRKRSPDLSALKKQLLYITYYGGWFFVLLSIVLGLLYLFAP